jgi:threonine synthase
MDVGDPSNFVRILEIFHHRFPELRSMLSSYTITDQETKAAMQEVYELHGYTLDPHGAVGWLALNRWLDEHPGSKGIFLETAHPVKFPDALDQRKIAIPASVQEIMSRKKMSTVMKPHYADLRDYLAGDQG